MDTSHQGLSESASLHALCNTLEALLNREHQSSGNPWVSIMRLNQLFLEQEGLSLEAQLQIRGHQNGLRTFFHHQRCFAIYGTSSPERFYVAWLLTLVPNAALSQSTTYRIKRRWKVDGRLLTFLKDEGATQQTSPSRSTHSPRLCLPPRDIRSSTDLITALRQIIHTSIAQAPNHWMTIGSLSQQFFNQYHHPIRTAVRAWFPDLTLVELLQRIPNLQIQQVDRQWQIMLRHERLS